MNMGVVSNSNWKPSPLLLGAFGLLISVAYIPGVIGAAVPTGWFILIGVMPIFTCLCIRQVNLYHINGMLFLAYCCLSLAWTPNFNIGLFYLFQLLALGLVFYLGSALNDLRPILRGLALGVGVSGILSIFQWQYGWNFVFRNPGANAGLFVNQDLLCEASAVLFVALITFKLWRWLPFAVPGIVLIHSRAAILALVCCFCLWVLSKSKTAALIFSLAFIGLAIVYLYNFGFDGSIRQRFDLWVDTARGFKIFGNGVGSYNALFPHYSLNIDTSLERPKFAHNDFLQLVFEYGIGTILLLILIYDVLIIERKERIILYAIGVISVFSFPLHVPVMAFVGCLVAGYITRFNDAVRIVGNNRGSILLARNKNFKPS